MLIDFVRRAWGVPALLLVVGLVMVDQPATPIASRPVAAVTPFAFPFAVGAPASPQPWNPSNWDVAVHTRDGYQNGGLDPMIAQHGSDCSPGGTHQVASDNDAVFTCRDHVMTAINAGGYGVVYLTPDHMLDFSRGSAALTFSVDTFRTSDRDWIDLWITPMADNLELPLESWLPDLQGPPAHALHIRMNEFNNGTIFTGEVYDNFGARALSGNWWTPLESLMKPSATVRTTFRLDLSTSHVRFGMPNYDGRGSGFSWIDTDIPSLGWNQGVVQLGHHSYTPRKAAGCGAPVEQQAAGLGCEPNTWHWGGVAMSASAPFSMIRAGQRRVTGGAGTANFPSPAPPGSRLRFDAVGDVQVSFDRGASWQVPSAQREVRHQSGHFDNYWTPVPPGATSVVFRGRDWYGGPWLARDLSIWSGTGVTSGPMPPPAPGLTSSPSPTQGASSAEPSPSETPKEPGQPSGEPAGEPGPTSHPFGVGAAPSMQPWIQSGPSPDGWWDQAGGAQRVDTELALAHRLGASNVRVEFPWSLIEPARGAFDWSRADLIVRSAAAHDVQLQPVVVFTPGWAGAFPTSPPDPGEFSSFMRALVGRYRGSVHSWELWNEPDQPHYWTGSEAQYVSSVLVPGYHAVRAADGSARVILGGVAGADLGWLNGVYALGGGDSFDVMSFHDVGASGTQVVSDAGLIESILRAHGHAYRPLWLGAYGVEGGDRQALVSAVLTTPSPIALAQWYQIREDATPPGRRA